MTQQDVTTYEQVRPIRLPPNTTPEQLCRQGLALEGNSKSKDDIAKQLNIDRMSYRRLRQIVLLHDKLNELTDADRAVVQSAFDMMQRTGAIARPFRMVEAISKRLWGSDRNNPRTDSRLKKRTERFLVYMESVSQVCGSAAIIDLPYLPREIADERVQWINQAIKDLNVLKTKLREML